MNEQGSVEKNLNSFTIHSLTALTPLIVIFLGILSCSEKNPIAGLNSTPEQPSTVSKPQLRMTLPASWDENWFSSPAVFDLDNDGKKEIIASRHSVLYVWREVI